MKQQLKSIAIAALALCTIGSASAATIYNGTYTETNTTGLYIGAYNSAALPLPDRAQFDHGFAASGASFTDTYFFDFGPAGSTSVNGNFIPGAPDDPAGIANFSVTLYNVVSATCGALVNLSTGGTCTPFSLGSAIQTGAYSASGNASSISFTPLLAGRYAFVVTGQTTTTNASYSGQLVTRNVPEPGSLALAGLALFGAGAAMRKRKA